MSDLNLLYSKDIKASEEYMSAVEEFKEKNFNFYQHFNRVFLNNDKFGIREDVFNFFKEHISELPADMSYTSELVSLAENLKISPEWFSWINERYQKILDFGVSDFAIILTGATQKNISISEFEEIFSSDVDVLTMYDMIDNFSSTNEAERGDFIVGESILDDPTDELNDALIPDEDIQAFSDAELDEDSQGNEPEKANENISAVYDDDIKSSESSDDIGMPQLLSSILTLVSDPDDKSLMEAQEELNGILNKLQNVLNELNVFSNGILRTMEKEREESKRLKALYKVMQKMVAKQQDQINELQNRNNELNNQLHAAEMREMRTVELQQKISELSNLASPIVSTNRLHA